MTAGAGDRQAQHGAAHHVDLLVVREATNLPASSRVFSTKLRHPNPDWSLREWEPLTFWTLGREVEAAVVTRGGDHEIQLVYTWRLRDAGLWKESWRSLLALESTRFARSRPRTAVRLSTPVARDQDLALERAHRRLKTFSAVFREALEAL